MRLQKGTIKNKDIIRFADLTGDKNRIHLDYMLAVNSLLGKRVSHGLFSIVIILGFKDDRYLVFY